MQASFGKRCFSLFLGGSAAATIMAAPLLLSVRGLTAPAKPVPPGIVLANLPQDAHAILDFHSAGCFTTTTYRFDYTPTPTPHVTVTSPDSTGKTSSLIGAVSLSAEQVRRLDNTIRFFRKYDRVGGCTTRDELTVTLYRGDKAVAAESHKEYTCRRSLLADAAPADLQALLSYQATKHIVADAVPLLSLGSLVSQAQRAKTQGVETVSYLDTPREATKAYKRLQTEREQAENQRRAEQLVITLPGYSQLSSQFHVTEVGLGATNDFPYSFYSSLSATTPRLVDASHWCNLLQDEKPLYNWTDFLRAHEAVEKAVAPHLWIQQWKNAGPARS